MQSSDYSLSILGHVVPTTAVRLFGKRLLFRRDVLVQNLVILEFVSAELGLSLFVCLALLLNRQVCLTMGFQLGGEEREQTHLSLNFRRAVWVLLPYAWLQEPSCA